MSALSELDKTRAPQQEPLPRAPITDVSVASVAHAPGVDDAVLEALSVGSEPNVLSVVLQEIEIDPQLLERIEAGLSAIAKSIPAGERSATTRQ